MWDINGRAGGSPTWYLRADRTPPQIAFSGPLWDDRAQIAEAEATLRITATDGSTASAAAQRSGVQRVEVHVDGELAYSSGDVACPAGSCTLTRDWTLRLADYEWADGSYEVTVTATDQLGHTSSTTFTPYFEHAAARILAADVAPSDADLGDATTEVCDDPCVLDSSINPEVQAALDEAPLVDAPADADGEPIASAAVVKPADWGISDETPEDVDDAYVRGGIRMFRKIVPWDIATGFTEQQATSADCYRDQWLRVRNLFDAWYANLTRSDRDDTRLLVSFEINLCKTTSQNRQAYGEYLAAVEQFRRRYPRVRSYTAWNEPNTSKQRWNKVEHADNAGRRFRLLQDSCNEPLRDTVGNVVAPRCVVAAGDVTAGNIRKQWLDNYKAGAKLKGKRHVWALHPYRPVQTRTRTEAREFLQATRGRVWLTEAGAFFRRCSRDLDQDPDEAVCRSEARDNPYRRPSNRAAQFNDLAWMLEKLIPWRYNDEPSRFTRVYYYQWTDGGEKWGTGLARSRDRLTATVGEAFCIWTYRLLRKSARDDRCGSPDY